MSPTSRRHFLCSTTLGAAAAMKLAPRVLAAEDASDQSQTDDAAADQIAILNDTHIHEKHGPGQTHHENLVQAIREILALPTRPAAVLINGDLAMSVGTPGDYRNFAGLIEPLHAAGLPVHLTLGNHDDRGNFLRAFPGVPSASRFRDHRHNGMIDLPHARLLLLDSLKETPAAPGRLGEEQIAWLLDEVDAAAEKPVVIVAHHNPRVGGDALHYPGGIEDTEAFWPELLRRPHVKAFIHGHVHDWNLGMNANVHVINTLASAMVANKAVSTNGWTLATFRPQGVALEIHTYLDDHPWNGEQKWLFWRQPKSTS